MFRHIPLVLALLPLSAAAESPPAAIDWTAAHPVPSPGRTLLLLDTPDRTALRVFPNWKSDAPQVAGGPPATEIHADLTLHWLNREAPTDFQRSVQPATGIVRSSCRMGGAKITRTVLVDPADGTVFIHLLADMPGALSFRVSLAASGAVEPRIEERREIALASADGMAARVRVVPFESDVAPDGQSIVVRGEGEALIVLGCSTAPDAVKSLAAYWQKLAARLDPGRTPPDPARIWHELLEHRRKSVENSP